VLESSTILTSQDQDQDPQMTLESLVGHQTPMLTIAEVETLEIPQTMEHLPTMETLLMKELE